jgi:hypothetical protein
MLAALTHTGGGWLALYRENGEKTMRNRYENGYEMGHY